MAMIQIKSNLATSDLKTRIAQLQSDITVLDGQISTQTASVIDAGGDPATDTTIISYNASKATKLQQVAELQAQLSENELNNTQSAIIATRAAATSNGAYVPGSFMDTPGYNAGQAAHISKPSNTMEYNSPSVVDAYYSTRASFLSAAGFSSNRPGTVASANELWSGSKSSKGMIVSYIPPSNGVEYQGGKQPPSSVSTYGTNYGFQFMYNPATISMSYSGMPNVDQGFEISGQDKFVMYGTNVTQSTISFQLLINRMFDMKYYDENGRVKGNATKAYAGKLPSAAAQKQIYTMGTMYDVEYLLRTLLGYTLKSYLRNNQTADMGYLGARPVELHLGKSLRYLGTVTSLNVDHVIFNEQMVPLFTNVAITFARLPDYPLVNTPVEPAPTPAPSNPGGGNRGGGALPGGDWGDMGVGGGGAFNDLIN
jgi:hypothetical protein